MGEEISADSNHRYLKGLGEHWLVLPAKAAGNNCVIDQCEHNGTNAVPMQKQNKKLYHCIVIYLVFA